MRRLAIDVKDELMRPRAAAFVPPPKPSPNGKQQIKAL